MRAGTVGVEGDVMKFWMSAVVAVLVSSTSVMAENQPSHGAGTSQPQTQQAPVVVQPQVDPQARYNEIVNACILQQGVGSSLSGRSVGGNVR